MGLPPKTTGSEENPANSRWGRIPIPRKPFATYSIIGLNIAVFGLELYLGGSTNLQVLRRLGALMPAEALSGSGWQLLTATMLHFGAMHLLMNMLGLAFLGSFVEIYAGAWRFWLIYWGSGLGSMLAIALIAQSGYAEGDLFVGASGCIMGIVGSTVWILWQGWRRQHSRWALRQLQVVGLMIGVQVAFDLTAPQISFVGHTSGLLIGFLIACGLLRGSNHKSV